MATRLSLRRVGDSTGKLIAAPDSVAELLEGGKPPDECAEPPPTEQLSEDPSASQARPTDQQCWVSAGPELPTW